MSLSPSLEPSTSLAHGQSLSPRLGQRVWTLFGWSPGARKLLKVRSLACGCLVGEYEWWNDVVVRVVDVVGPRCADQTHASNTCIGYVRWLDDREQPHDHPALPTGGEV